MSFYAYERDSKISGYSIYYDRLYETWCQKGYVLHDGFVCLSKAIDRSIVKLNHDDFFGKALYAVSSKLGCTPRGISYKALNKAKVLWYPDIYPRLIYRQSARGRGWDDFCVHPQVAKAYVLGSRLKQQVEYWKHYENLPDLEFESLVPHADVCCEELVNYEVFFDYFKNYEVAMLDTHHYRILYLGDDCNRWDCILNLEKQYFGISTKQVRLNVQTQFLEQHPLDRVSFFRERSYLPFWCLDYFVNILQIDYDHLKYGRRQPDELALVEPSSDFDRGELLATYISSIDGLKSVASFLQYTELERHLATSHKSPKFAVLDYLAKLGYHSPFATQD